LRQAFLGTLLTLVFMAHYFCTLFPATARWSSLGACHFVLRSTNQERNTK